MQSEDTLRRLYQLADKYNSPIVNQLYQSLQYHGSNDLECFMRVVEGLARQVAYYQNIIIEDAKNMLPQIIIKKED